MVNSGWTVGFSTSSSVCHDQSQSQGQDSKGPRRWKSCKTKTEDRWVFLSTSHASTNPVFRNFKSSHSVVANTRKNLTRHLSKTDKTLYRATPKHLIKRQGNTTSKRSEKASNTPRTFHESRFHTQISKKIRPHTLYPYPPCILSQCPFPHLNP